MENRTLSPVARESHTPPLLRLPHEILREIFLYLDTHDLKIVQSVGETQSVSPVLAHVAADRRLPRQLHLTAEDLKGKTLHQVVGGHANVRRLSVRGGIRFNKTNCNRIAKDLPKLTQLRLHFPGAENNGSKELSNVTACLPRLSSIDINFVQQFFTEESLLRAISNLRRVETFVLVQSERRMNERSSDRRANLNWILSSLAGSPNAVWSEIRITFESRWDVTRLTLEGVKPMVDLHWQTLTSLHLRHLEFSPLIRTTFAQLVHLKHLGLTGVLGFNANNWIDFFISGVVATTEPPLTTCTFPLLETLELDFIPDEAIRLLGKNYGDRLKCLGLYEYTRMFEYNNGNGPVRMVTCPKEFSEILRSFKALTRLTFGILAESPDQKRIVRWFVKKDVDSLPFTVEFIKL